MTVSLPIEGDIIIPSYNTQDQLPVEELEAIFQEAWGAGVTAIGWTQYTPFFNDGDVCVFSAGGEVYSTAELSPEDIDRFYPYPDADDEVWKTISYKPGYEWNREARGYVQIPDYQAPTGEAEAAKALSAISSGEFYDVLRNNFGEHAQVVATPTQYYVQYFEHE